VAVGVGVAPAYVVAFATFDQFELSPHTLLNARTS
jgi:hypothetical protein